MGLLNELHKLLGGAGHVVSQGVDTAEHAIDNTAHNVNNAINNVSIPDSTFDPVRSMLMHKSDLEDYQYTRDSGIAHQNAQKSPSGIVQAYGSFNPYTQPSKVAVDTPSIAPPKFVPTQNNPEYYAQNGTAKNEAESQAMVNAYRERQSPGIKPLYSVPLIKATPYTSTQSSVGSGPRSYQ